MRDSIWFRTLEEEDRAALERSDALPATADVVIVGAGMIGLACAHYLAEAGVSGICVIDREAALAEASGANAGGLWFAQQSPELGPLAPLAGASSRLYGELAADPDFRFDFRRTGAIELSGPGRDTGAVVRAVRAAGFRAEEVGAGELARLEPALASGEAAMAVYYPDEAQVHPAKLGASFARKLKNRNVRLCFGCEALRIEPGRVVTATGALVAGEILIAAGAWTPLLTAALGWNPPIKPMRGQLLATRALPPPLGHTVLGERYYSWQLPQGHVASGGTVEDAGFERGVRAADLRAIRAERNALFPALRDEPDLCAWSGFRPWCAGLRPVLGRIPGQEHVYAAAGHFKKGILLAPVTGRMMADLITRGTSSLPLAPFDPARF